MGTQQILLIVLSVIIVGIAVAVGITMFNAQATNSNRQAIMGDMNNLASSALAYYKTPETHGGGGGDWDAGVDALGQWLGFDYVSGTGCSTGNGVFGLAITGSGDILTITGVGTENGNNGSTGVSGTLTVTGSTSGIVALIVN
jgi:hypothetical protein